MEISGGVELLSEETGLALFGLGVLFVRGQVENQVGDNECLRWLVKPGDILLAEAGEVDSIDLSSLEHRNQKHEYHRPKPRTLTSTSKPNFFCFPDS